MRTPHPPELHVESFFDRASGFGGLRLRVEGRDAAIPTPAFDGGRLFFGGGFGPDNVSVDILCCRKA
jgi:hypothetical protein